MANKQHSEAVGRRSFLRRAGLAAGAAAAVPVLGPGWAAAAAPAPDTGSPDPDQLFTAGSFAAADRGYARLLTADPANAHAAAQRGYIALLHNRFAGAETYLSRAIDLAPDDILTKQRLADCFVRQDQHARAIPLLRTTGVQHDDAFAELYAHLSGAPWQVRGAQRTRVPFLGLDPIPSVEASVNGGPPKGFLLDTYSTLDMAQEAAEEAGLRAVASTSGVVNGKQVTMYLGVMDSFRIGDIEIRNIPAQWIDAQRPPLPDGSQPAGVIGTTTLYHLLATMDYARQALVLRRRTAAASHEMRAQAGRAGIDRLPLWLAGDHYPVTVGSLRDYGPRLVTVDSGGLDHGLDTSVEYAERAGIAVDYDHPIQTSGGTVYPVTPDRISLGHAVGHDVYGWAAAPGSMVGYPGPGQSARFGFDLIANFTHEFFRPFAITFDYSAMNFYIERNIERK